MKPPRGLEGFHEAVRAWFGASYGAPTRVQALGWPAIRAGGGALLLAPTGSGKTLAAFLVAIDRLMFEPAPEPAERCRVLYVSPLKALAVDVERNLRAPLVGILRAAERMGAEGTAAVPVHEPTVAIRTGDTPARERAAFARRPADILVTTPESLYLAAHQRSPRDPSIGAAGDRGRDPRPGGHEARCAPGGLAGAAGGAGRSAAPADRPVGDRPAGGGSGPLSRRVRRSGRPAAGGGGGRGTPEGPRPHRGGPRGRHGQARPVGRDPGRPGRRRRTGRKHLAGDPPDAPRAHPRPPLHAPLRQQSAAGGASHGRPERAGGGGAGPGAPRLDCARGARPDRGRPQVRTAAGAGGDLVAGAGH